MAGRPVTQDDYDQVKALHAQGLGRNDIMRILGRSGQTVSRIAGELGLTFERGPAIAAATAARKVDAKAKRAALALNLLEDAERMRTQLWQPCKAYNFGGKDNTYNEHQLDQPGFRDQREIMSSVGIAIDRAVRLDEYDGDPGIDAAKSMLGALAAGLGAAYDKLNQADADAASD